MQKNAPPPESLESVNQSRKCSRLIQWLERTERKLTMPQRKSVLICFTVVVGIYFLHLVVAGVVGAEPAYPETLRKHRPPPVLAAPPPADTFPNLKLLP